MLCDFFFQVTATTHNIRWVCQNQIILLFFRTCQRSQYRISLQQKGIIEQLCKLLRHAGIILNQTGHVNQHISFRKNYGFLLVFIESLIKSGERDLWFQFITIYHIETIQVMQNRFEQEFSNTTSRIANFHARRQFDHINNSTHYFQWRKILSPVLLTDGFFKESFKQFAFKIVVNVFKRSKIVETVQNTMEHCRIARDSLIIL